jgi:hypothetical protein
MNPLGCWDGLNQAALFCSVLLIACHSEFVGEQLKLLTAKKKGSAHPKK